MSLSFDNVCNLKEGDVVYEAIGTYNAKMVVRNVTVEKNAYNGTNDRVVVEVDVLGQEGTHKLLMTAGMGHYGPKLYLDPPYISRMQGGGWVVPILGVPEDQWDRFNVNGQIVEDITLQSKPTESTDTTKKTSRRKSVSKE